MWTAVRADKHLYCRYEGDAWQKQDVNPTSSIDGSSATQPRDVPDHVDNGRVVERHVLDRQQLDSLLRDYAPEEGGRRWEVGPASAHAMTRQ